MQSICGVFFMIAYDKLNDLQLDVMREKGLLYEEKAIQDRLDKLLQYD